MTRAGPVLLALLLFGPIATTTLGCAAKQTAKRESHVVEHRMEDGTIERETVVTKDEPPPSNDDSAAGAIVDGIVTVVSLPFKLLLGIFEVLF